MKKPEFKVLVWDVETCLHLGHFFSLGKQVLNHKQLMKGYFFRPHIMCITYRWLHENTTHILTWGKSEKDERQMIEDFSQLLSEADVAIGKNSNRFDNKQINTQRLVADLPGMPEWIKHTDDLETQMRKYLYLPSYSLDYFSELIGLGGKNPMEYSDWTAMAYYRMLQLTGVKSEALLELLTGKSIRQIETEGIKATNKMFKYGKKDTADTARLIKYCGKHFEWKFNVATHKKDLVCKTCGSANIVKNGTRPSGQSTYQHFFCRDHGGYAGRCSIGATGSLGKMS